MTHREVIRLMETTDVFEVSTALRSAIINHFDHCKKCQKRFEKSLAKDPSIMDPNQKIDAMLVKDSYDPESVLSDGRMFDGRLDSPPVNDDIPF